MLGSTTTCCVEIACISGTNDAAGSHKLSDLYSWQYTRYARFYQVSVKVTCGNTDGRCLKTGFSF